MVQMSTTLTPMGITALCYSAHSRKEMIDTFDIAKLLLTHGTEINQTNYLDGNNALMLLLCGYSHCREIVRVASLLLFCYYYLLCQNTMEEFGVAGEDGYYDKTTGKLVLDWFRRLVESGIDLRAQNADGLTAAQLLDSVPKNLKILPEMIQILSAATSAQLLLKTFLLNFSCHFNRVIQS